jgi:membrane protein required for colicin V production
VLVLFVIGKLLTGISKIVMLGWLDRLLGLVFALLIAGLLVGIGIILFDTLNAKFELVDNAILDEAVLYSPLRDIAYTVFPYLKELLLKQ